MTGVRRNWKDTEESGCDLFKILCRETTGEPRSRELVSRIRFEADI